MVACLKALRLRNHNETEVHLSTTQFHMQVGALLSDRPDNIPLCPYHSLARSQKVRSPVAADKAGLRGATGAQLLIQVTHISLCLTNTTGKYYHSKQS